MKKFATILLTAALLAASGSQAQANRSKVEDAVIEKSCGEVTIDENGDRDAFVEERIKILTQTGRTAHADKSIFIDKGFAEFSLVKAGTYKPDGRFEETEAAGINEVTPPALNESLMYGGFASKIISFSSADPGNSIYYSYRMKTRNEEGYDSAVVEMQGDTRILEESLSVSYPEGTGLKYSSNAKVEKKGNRVKATGRNVPAFKTENNRPSNIEIGLYFAYTSAADWSHATKFLSDEIEKSADYRNDEIVRKAKSLFGNATDDKEKLRACLRFLNQDVKSVYLPLNTGSLKPRKASETLKTGYGDPKDKTVLFMALAKAGGIDTRAVLLNSSYTPIIDGVPTIKQFDTILPAAKRDDGEWGIFNVNASNSRTGYLSTRNGAQAMLIGEKPEKIAKRPFFDVKDSTYGSISSTLRADGSCRSSIKVTASGLFDSAIRKVLLSSKGKNLDLFMDRSADSFSPGSRVSNYKTSEAEDYSKDVEILMNLESPSFGVIQGDYLITMVTPPPFSISYVPYDVSLQDRTYPYVLGSEKTSEYKVEMRLPEGFEPVYMPESTTTMGDGWSLEIKCEYKAASGSVAFKRRLETKAASISPKEYKTFKKAVENSARQENKLILLERKAGK